MSAELKMIAVLKGLVELVYIESFVEIKKKLALFDHFLSTF